MATRLDLRNKLKDKILGLEDEGYGDFEFADTELDTYLELAVTRLYPAVYHRATQEGVVVSPYGSRGLGKVDTAFADRVFLLEDAIELDPVTGWSVRPGRIVDIDVRQWSTVNVHYHDAYVLPDDDGTPTEIPELFTPLIILGALVEALESRHDTGVRGDPQPHGYHAETQLIDRLSARYATLKEEVAMSLPSVVV